MKRTLRDLFCVACLLSLIAVATRLSSGAHHTPPSGPWHVEGLVLGMKDSDRLEVRGKRSVMSQQFGGGPDSNPFYDEKPSDYPNVNRYHIRRARFWSFEQGQGEIMIGAGALVLADQKVVGLFGKHLGWQSDLGLNSGDTGETLRQCLGDPLGVTTCGANHEGLCEHWSYRDGLTVFLVREASGKPLRVGMFMLGNTSAFRDALGSGGWPDCVQTASASN